MEELAEVYGRAMKAVRNYYQCRVDRVLAREVKTWVDAMESLVLRLFEYFSNMHVWTRSIRFCAYAYSLYAFWFVDGDKVTLDSFRFGRSTVCDAG